MKSRILLFVMVMLFVGISVSVDATMLCSNPSGSVFVRAQCNGNEQQLNPIALGLVGPQGPAGPADRSLTYVRYSLPVTTLIEQFGTARATCDAGDRVLAGGPDTGAVDIVAERSLPDDTDSSWTVTLKPTADSITWFAVAVCLETH